MRKLFNSVPFLVFVLVCIALYFSLRPSTEKYEREITNLDLSLISGEKLELQKFHGQFYIVHLFATWCGVCKDDLTFLHEIHKQKQVPIIGIAIRDDLNKVKLFSRKNLPYDYIANDYNKKVAKILITKSIPQTIIINKEGKILLNYVGGLDSRVTKRIIGMLE